MQISFQIEQNYSDDKKHEITPVINIPNPRSKIQSVYEQNLFEYKNVKKDVLKENDQEEIQKIFKEDLLLKGINIIFDKINPNAISEQILSKYQFNISELRGINIFLKSISALGEWSNGRYREAQKTIEYSQNFIIYDLCVPYLQFLKRIPDKIPIECIKIDLTFLELNNENLYQISDLLKLALNKRKIKSFSFSVYEPIVSDQFTQSEEEIQEQEAFEFIIQQLQSVQEYFLELEDIELIFSKWSNLQNAKSLYSFLEELTKKNGNFKSIRITLGLNENGFQLGEYSTNSLTQIIKNCQNLKGLYLHIGNSWENEYNEHLKEYTEFIRHKMVTNCNNLTSLSLDMTQQGTFESNLSLLISLQIFLKDRYFDYLNLNFGGWRQRATSQELRAMAAEQLVKALIAPKAVRNYFIGIPHAKLYQYLNEFWFGLAQMAKKYYFKRLSLRFINLNDRIDEKVCLIMYHSIITQQHLLIIDSLEKKQQISQFTHALKMMLHNLKEELHLKILGFILMVDREKNYQL